METRYNESTFNKFTIRPDFPLLTVGQTKHILTSVLDRLTHPSCFKSDSRLSREGGGGGEGAFVSLAIQNLFLCYKINDNDNDDDNDSTCVLQKF